VSITYRFPMALVRSELRRLATAAGVARTLAADVARAGTAAIRTHCTPSGAIGAGVEAAWFAARTALYPLGLVREQLSDDPGYRTDALPPLQRSLVVTDITAAGTPILLVHGIMDNRSVFTLFRRALRRRGFGTLFAVNYSLLTDDLRAAAEELHGHVAELRARTGAEKVHIVGHSLGGMIARYYVQRMGGCDSVDTLVTLGSPHAGTTAAYLLPTPLARQLCPDSDVITELAEPAPRCTTRFLVVWSRADLVILPPENARLRHPDLDVEELELSDVGHFALPIDSRAVHWVATRLARSSEARHPVRRRRLRRRRPADTLRTQASPAS
jgi:triacylglycerol lipase